MSRHRLTLAAMWAAFGVWILLCAPPTPAALLDRLRLPKGFSISLYAPHVDGARSLTLGPQGTVFVGSRGEGVVYALRDTDHDGRCDSVYVVARGLNEPNGVAAHGPDLIVAEVNRILVFTGLESRLASPPDYHVLEDDLPRDSHHGWKFIAVGPDSQLYVPVGAPCNVCKKEDPRYASILRMSLTGTGLEVFASGIRNTVGFDWQPDTRVLWFTDNGRDMMGDNLPPDELNRADKAGLNFGFPFCHGKNVVDPEFGRPDSCSGFEPPALELEAHVAALGMRFYTGTMFPPAYRGRIFMAQHGSWNRSTPIGYRVCSVSLKGSEVEGYEPFVTGWLDEDGVSGRPVDVLVMPDGALLISDDFAGRVYRVTYASPDSTR